uniref:(northern house mosquito) hypothetical protein n=1 Tax=Culex pipiens TaxID=7175 RepID=A0A8D8HEA1_CULPI
MEPLPGRQARRRLCASLQRAPPKRRGSRPKAKNLPGKSDPRGSGNRTGNDPADSLYQNPRPPGGGLAVLRTHEDYDADREAEGPGEHHHGGVFDWWVVGAVLPAANVPLCDYRSGQVPEAGVPAVARVFEGEVLFV